MSAWLNEHLGVVLGTLGLFLAFLGVVIPVIFGRMRDAARGALVAKDATIEAKDAMIALLKEQSSWKPASYWSR